MRVWFERIAVGVGYLIGCVIAAGIVYGMFGPVLWRVWWLIPALAGCALVILAWSWWYSAVHGDAYFWRHD